MQIDKHVVFLWWQRKVAAVRMCGWIPQKTQWNGGKGHKISRTWKLWKIIMADDSELTSVIEHYRGRVQTDMTIRKQAGLCFGLLWELGDVRTSYIIAKYREELNHSELFEATIRSWAPLWRTIRFHFGLCIQASPSDAGNWREKHQKHSPRWTSLIQVFVRR